MNANIGTMDRVVRIAQASRRSGELRAFQEFGLLVALKLQAAVVMRFGQPLML